MRMLCSVAECAGIVRFVVNWDWLVSMKINRNVHNDCMLPVTVYASETWAPKKAHMELLSVAQRNMERIMLCITLRDHKRNTWIRHIIYVIKK